MRLPPELSSLRELGFRLLFAAETVSNTGTAMANVALAFAVLSIGGPTDLGLVLLGREVPTVILLLAGGVWSDRLPRHLLLVWADATRGVTQGLTAALFLTGHATILAVMALQLVYGAVTAFARPAFQGLVPEVVEGRQLQRANALLGLSHSVVWIAGPAIGALIVAAATPGWALAVDAATFVISAWLLVRLDLPRNLRLTGRSMLGDFRDGWREFTSRAWLVAIVAGFGLFQLTLFPALLVLGPFVAQTTLGGAGAWGTILALQGVGSFLGGMIALRVRFTRPLVAMVLLTLPAGLELILLGAEAPLWAIAATAFVGGIGFAAGGAVWFATLQEKIPRETISRISSFDWFGSVALNPIGYALIGPLATIIGVGESLILAGVLNVACSLAMVAIPSVRAVRSGPEVAPEPQPA